MPTFTPVDHDPFESATQAAAPLTPVDHDPFAAPVEESGYVAGVAKALGRGIAGIGVAGGHALEWNEDVTRTGDESKRTVGNRIGKGIADFSEGVQDAIPAPVAGDNYAKESVFGGVESLPVSVAYAVPSTIAAIGAGALATPKTLGRGTIPAAIGGAAIGQAAVAPIMFRSTAQETAEQLLKRKPDIDREALVTAAKKAGHKEWQGEAISDIPEAVIFSRIPGLSAGVKTVKQLLQPGVKQFAKNVAMSLPGEQLGEGYTAYGQAEAVNEALPAEMRTDPWQGVRDQAGPTTVMTLLMGGLGTGLQRLRTNQIANTLADPAAETEKRGKAAGQVYGLLEESNGKEVADNFLRHAYSAIGDERQTGSAPYGLDLNDPALLAPVGQAGAPAQVDVPAVETPVLNDTNPAQVPVKPAGVLTRAVATVAPVLSDNPAMAAPVAGPIDAAAVPAVPAIGEQTAAQAIRPNEELQLDEARSWAKDQARQGNTQLLQVTGESQRSYNRRVLDSFLKTQEQAAPPAVTVKPAPVRNDRVNPEKDDLVQALRKLGGLDADQVRSEWGATVGDQIVAMNRRAFGGAVKKGGRSLDDMTTALVEQGYLPEGAQLRDLEALVSRAAGGEQVLSDRGQERRAETIAKANDELGMMNYEGKAFSEEVSDEPNVQKALPAVPPVRQDVPQSRQLPVVPAQQAVPAPEGAGVGNKQDVDLVAERRENNAQSARKENSSYGDLSDNSEGETGAGMVPAPAVDVNSNVYRMAKQFAAKEGLDLTGYDDQEIARFVDSYKKYLKDGSAAPSQTMGRLSASRRKARGALLGILRGSANGETSTGRETEPAGVEAQAGAASLPEVQGVDGREGDGVPVLRTADEIEAKAHEAATSPQNSLPQPTAAQIEAGNYRKGHVNLHGLDISIENPAGSTRSGTDADGKQWETTLAHHYGYIKGSVGRDKDHVDVFIGKNTDSRRVFVVDQVDPRTGDLDEHKILLGFNSPVTARSGYLKNYDKSGRQRIGAISETTVEELKLWLQDGDQKKAFAPGGLSDEVSQVRQESGEKQEEVPDLRDEDESTVSGGVALDDAQQGETEVGAGLVPAQTNTYGQANTVFTADKAAAARELLRAKLSQLNSGLDPEMIAAGIDLAGYHVEAGARSFAEYSRRMLEELGEKVKPYLKSWYMAVRYHPGFDAAGMDNEAAVEKAEPGVPVERRRNTERRKSLEAMSQGELRRELFTDPLTGLGNKRAYEEVNRKPFQALLDVDSLKWVNDHMNHGKGDELLKAVGAALAAETSYAYHISGDEFAVHTANLDTLREIVRRVEAKLQAVAISHTLPDGTVLTKQGVQFSFGIGKNMDEADAALQVHKQQREEQGLRSARGEEPPGVVRKAAADVPAADVETQEEGTEEAGRKALEDPLSPPEASAGEGAKFALKKKASPEAYGAIYEQYADVLDRMAQEFRSGRYASQPWTVVPAAKLQKIWSEYAKSGIVRDEKGLDAILQRLTENAVRLQINNELSGHESTDPAEVAESAEIAEDDHQAFIDWAVDLPDGSWRISDYGLPKVLDYLALAHEAENAEDKLTYLDMALNVAHQRSDLAAWFVEGGSETLSAMAGTGLPEDAKFAVGQDEKNSSFNIHNSSLKAADITAALAPILKAWPNAPTVKVVQSVTDLPAGIRTQMLLQGIKPGQVQAVFTPNDEVGIMNDERESKPSTALGPDGSNPHNSSLVYLVADNLSSVEEAQQKLLHETVTHFGVRAVLDPASFEKTMLQADLFYINKRGAEYRKIIKTYGFDRLTREGRIAAAEEMIAHEAESGATSTMLDRIIAAVREFLRKAGFQLGLADAEIRELLARAVRFLEGGPGGGRRAEGAMFAAAPAVETAAFKRWFGGSKVVNEDGKPLVVYHGTRNSFDTFRNGIYEGPIFFSTSPEFASKFAGDVEITDPYVPEHLKKGYPSVMPAYLKIEKLFDPYDAKAVKEIISQLPAGLYPTALRLDLDRRISKGEWKALETLDVRDAIKAAGYDGMIVYESLDGEIPQKNYAVFSPPQIKSAIGNTGDFNPNNPDIRFALRDTMQQVAGNLSAPDWGNLADNLKRTLNPLDWQRFAGFLEDVTPPGILRAIAMVRNPVFEAEKDARKASFVKTGEAREVARMDLILKLMGWEGATGTVRDMKQRLTEYFTKWESGDTKTAYGDIRKSYYAMSRSQQAAFDKLVEEGDLQGRSYASLEKALTNPRIRAAAPELATFKLYKALRKHVDGHVADERNKIGAKLYMETAKEQRRTAAAIEKLAPEQVAKLDEWLSRWTEKGVILDDNPGNDKQTWAAYELIRDYVKPKYIEHVADARRRQAELSGWMTRHHGEGEFAAKVYQVIDKLALESEKTGTGRERAHLPYYPGVRLAKELEELAEKFGLMVTKTAKGAMVFQQAETKDDEKNSSFIIHNSSLEYTGDVKGFVAAAKNVDLKNDKGQHDRVPVYVRYVTTRHQARTRAEEIRKDMKKWIPHSYREGMTYDVKDYGVDKLTETMYGDVKGDTVMEYAQEQALQRALNRGEIDQETYDTTHDSIMQNTAEVLMGRAAGRYQIRRAEYLIEGYDTENTMQLYTDYITGIAGMYSKAIYARDQLKNFRVADGETKTWAHPYIADSLRNMGLYDRMSGAARSVATFMYLGFKPASVIINASQPWTLGVAELGKIAKKPAVLMFRAQRDIFRDKLSKDEREMFAGAVYLTQQMETAVAEMSGMHEGLRGRTGMWWQRVMGKSMAPFQEVEMLNRKSTILAAYRALRSPQAPEGMLDKEAMEKALEVNRKVNFEMSRANLPRFARNPAGRMLYSLQGFAFNTLNNMYNKLTSGEQEDMKAVLRYLAATAIIGGALALPGGDEADRLYRRLFGKSLKLEFQQWTKVHAHRYGTPGEMLYAFAWHGVPAMAGVNVSNSLRLQMPFVSAMIQGDSLPESMGGVFSGLVQKGTNAARFAARGNMYRAAESLAPEAIAGPMRAVRQMEGVTTSHGKPVFDESGKPLKYSGTDAAKRMLGLQPLEQSERTAITVTGQALKRQWNEERVNLLDSLRGADTAEKRRSVTREIMKWNRALHKSQVQGIVLPIRAETMRAALTPKADKRQVAWLKSQQL